jgi:hypothetical protein
MSVYYTAPEGTPPPTIDDDGNIWFGDRIVARVRPGAEITMLRDNNTPAQQEMIDRLNRRLKNPDGRNPQ